MTTPDRTAQPGEEAGFSTIEAAYIRGATWSTEMGMRYKIEELRKAAYDYADKTTASLSPAPTSGSEAGGEATHIREMELREIADGAYGDGPAVRRAALDELARLATPAPSPAVGVRELLGKPDDWAEALSELQMWTGSAFLAGEKVKDEPDHKSRLYSFLCGLLGFLRVGQEAASAALSPAALAAKSGSEGEDGR